MGKILIRVDGSHEIGSGHLMRCLALAEAFKTRDMVSIFLTKYSDINSQAIIKKNKFELIEIPCNFHIDEEISFIKKKSKKKRIELIICDIHNPIIFKSIEIYHNYLNSLMNNDLFLITIEELMDYPFMSNIVIIPYLNAGQLKVIPSETTKYLLGSKYFIYRKEFLKKYNYKVRKKVKKILISMGGADPFGFTLKIIKVLSEIELDIELRVILGQSTKIQKKSIEKIMKDYKGKYSIVIGTEDMAGEMSESDIAIINSGLLKYETSLLGLPAITISNCNEHEKFMRDFASYGSIIHIGPGNNLNLIDFQKALNNLLEDYDLRFSMSNKGKKIFDTKGVDRIILAIPKELMQ